MRHHIIAVSALSLLCLAGSTGLAEAQPAGAHGPSAMVFTIAQGSGEPADTVLRASTLSCAYTAEGTHPDPRAACDALNATDGELDRLLATPSPSRYCPMYFDPVTVTADGVLQGRRVAWKHTFSNACVMSATLNDSPVYAF
ncbi:subtilase-type protease inhibitor [Streptomyces sp. NPDC056254]|uniref:subtilase-type protease inhibitor n=1 Tax=unclassified Streptomyces TaxID=2593676 RepID=UPI0004AAE33B|nr:MULTISPECIES: subtilase-type protease inhibitor [unclassified Streptomyces]APU38691.1 serine protease [Streptomyces sp. TN58]KJK52631.1 serine protease [Streptomyces sp. NRRL F-4428]